MVPTATRKFYQPVLVKMYCDYAITEAWLSFHDVTTVQNCEARVLDFHCKHMTYTAAIELSDLMKGKCPTPSSAKATINIDHKFTTATLKNIIS